MGTSTLEPFRIYILSNFLKTKNKTKNLNMPRGAGLTKPMKLSAELADIVGKKEASRAECIKQLWAYIKKNNLQDPENKQFFIPDKKMAKIFGNDKIRAFGMAKFLSAHLSWITIYFHHLHKLNADHLHFNHRRHFYERKEEIITYYKLYVFRNQKYTLLLICFIHLNSHTTYTNT